MSADFDLFINRVRSLFNIDGYQLPEWPEDEQRAFVRDPARYFINTDAEQSAAIFREVEKRQRRAATVSPDGLTDGEIRAIGIDKCCEFHSAEMGGGGIGERFVFSEDDLVEFVRAILAKVPS